MKIIRIIPVLSLYVLLLPCTGSGMGIDKAVLYNDQAVLVFDDTIKGTLSFEAPPDLIPDSLVVTPRPGGTVRSVSMEPLRSPSGSVKALQEKLADARASLAETKREQAMVDRQIEVIFLSAGSKDKPVPFSRQQISDALGFMDARIPGLNRRAVELSRKITSLETEVKDLQNRLNAVNKDPGWLIRITGDGPVDISFGVRSASWRPEYRVQASPAASKLTMETSVSIRQATGMDWDIGELHVSTGSPSHGIQAPELEPWYLRRPSLRAMKAMPESMDAASMVAAAPMEETVAPVETTSTSYLIGAAANVHLAGDGTPETVLLARRLLTAGFTLVSVPRFREGAYLRAEVVLATDAPLVPGSYSSFVDGVYAGRGLLARTEPGQKTTIDLGIDEGIVIERKETQAFHEKTITGRDRTTYAYEITVENTRSKNASLILRDQIPVSRDEDIEVKLIGTSPEIRPDSDGFLTWELSLEPKQKRKVAFSYSITGLHELPR